MASDRATEVSLEIKRRIENKQDHLKVADVYYGDQEKLPRYPAVCVESGPTTRELTGAGGKGRTDNNFEVYVIIYVGDVTQSTQVTRLDSELLGEKIVDVLHEDVTMGGKVIHGFVHSVEPGYSIRGKSLIRAVRITWRGFNKTLIT